MSKWVRYEKKENLLSMIDGCAVLREKDSAIFENTIKRLKDLAIILEQQEEELYSSLDVRDLAELQRKLYAVNADIGFRSLNNLSDTDFDNMVLSAAQGLNLSKPIIFTLERDSTAKRLLLELASERAESTFVEFLRELRQWEKSSGSARGTKKLHLTEKRGLGTTLGEYEIELSDNKILLKVKQKGTTKKERLAELAARLDATLEEESDSLRNRLENMILDKIQHPELRRLTEEEFKQRGEWYDVNSSKASIKGFLGEIHANVAMRYLFNKANIFATGNIRDLKGQEIPIDLVVENVGFQIKNYRIENGETLFRYGGQAGNFIENRVRPEQDLQDLLVTFFGAYQYHGKNEEFQQEASKRLLNGGAISSIFNSYLSNIMRISDTFGAKNNEQNLFLQNQTYYNTFFLISDKLVPSSAIIYGICEELRSQNGSVYRANWEYSKPTEFEKKTYSTPNLLADKIKIDLYLKLNVANVLKIAQHRAQQKEGVKKN